MPGRFLRIFELGNLSFCGEPLLNFSLKNLKAVRHKKKDFGIKTRSFLEDVSTSDVYSGN